MTAEVFVTIILCGGLLCGAAIFALGFAMGRRARQRDELLRDYYAHPIRVQRAIAASEQRHDGVDPSGRPFTLPGVEAPTEEHRPVRTNWGRTLR